MLETDSSFRPRVDRPLAVRGLPPSVLESWPDPAAAVREGRILFANQALAAYLGHGSPATLVGQLLEELIHPDDRAISAARLQTALATGKADPALLWRLRHRDGAILEADVALLALAVDSPETVVLVVRDLSQRRRLEAQLAAADKAAALTGLAGSIANEINNPIGYLLTNLDFAQEEIARLQLRLGELPLGGPPGAMAELAGESRRLQEVSAAIEDAIGGARRVSRLVRSLRELSADVGTVRRPLDLRATAEAALDLLGGQLRLHGTLVCKLEAAPLVQGNEQQLLHVFVALFNRALASIRGAGGQAHQVDLAIGTDRQGFAFAEVGDTGPLLPLADHAKLFELFVDEAANERLGLPIAASIARAHGGELTVRSSQAEGTRLRLTLPPAMGVTPALKAISRKARLLVVDDEVGYCVSLQRLLSKVYDVAVATRAQVALERLEAGETFDLILCDMLMPGMNGMQFAAALESLPLAVKPPVVFVTGGVFTVEAREVLQMPGVMHLLKPFDRKQLAEVVDRLVSH